MEHFEYTMEELLPIVIKLSEKYTGKDSTSITYERAQSLMEAVLYCIHETDCDTDGDSHALENVPDAAGAYHVGYHLVVKRVMTAKKLYEDMLPDFNDYGNRTYYDTVIKGMPRFFRYYDPVFRPQNHILTLDYPTILPVFDNCGIDAIYRYLQYVSLEQTFLSAFSADYVKQVLSHYHSGYEELVINVCSITARSLLGRMVENPGEKSREELEECLAQALGEILERGYGSNPELYHYLQADIRGFSFEFKNAVEHGCLDRMFF